MDDATLRDAHGTPSAQLRLLEAPAPDWRLDETTREVGRRGVAAARAALRSARRRTPDELAEQGSGHSSAA